MQELTRLRLVELAPGRRLYIPPDGRPRGISQALSQEQACDLQQYSGECIDVPASAYRSRKAAVLDRHKEGASVRQLISEFGLSRRQIQRITRG